MIIKVISILLFTIATYNIQMLNDQIAQVIFNNQQSYILYVCQRCDEEQLQVISQYCENKFCALVNRQVEMYERLKEFVGMKDSQYLLLLDLQKRLKYTLSANNNKLTKQDISSFQKSFSKGTLQPHYTSEDLPNQEPDKYMRKIVGLNFRQFIEGEQRIKILYLYIDNAVCDTCYDIYNKLSSIAKGLIDRNDITFGYLDLYKNQHKDLKEQSLPLILIYEKGVNQYEKFTKESLYRIQDIINSKLKIDDQQELNQL